MNNDISKLHSKLNMKDILSAEYLRRNHPLYPLICYTNNIIALYLSSNYENIPLIINRAYEVIVSTSKHYENELCVRNVLEYLRLISKFLISINLEKELLDLIPKQLAKNE